MAKILNRWTNNLICEEALLELKQLAEKQKADLRGADLCGADLRGADLCGADLRGADLCGADLCDADLRDADLCGAKNIESLEWTNQARQQTLFIFSYQPKSEVEGLRQKLLDGKVNGEVYEGDCCCLIGSLGNDKAASCIPYYKKGLHNVAEQLFYQIKDGDKPDTNIFSKIALELCDVFLGINNHSKE